MATPLTTTITHRHFAIASRRNILFNSVVDLC